MDKVSFFAVKALSILGLLPKARLQIVENFPQQSKNSDLSQDAQNRRVALC